MTEQWDPLDAKRIEARLKTKVIGHPLEVCLETTSTNDLARERAEAGQAEGWTVFAEQQTAGRGRFGHKWDSAPGVGLWFSILFRLPQNWGGPELLLQTAALSTAEAAEPYVTGDLRLKWPNDLLLNGGKLAGFLLEVNANRQFQVLGIGLNVHRAPELPDYPTAALSDFARAALSREELAIGILEQIERNYLAGASSDLRRRLARYGLASEGERSSFI
jgi:BirA family transcriptional regulator, biotin operon repressor / biotin---[acetyl-CoA-carboxylase] ligase